MAIGGLLRPVMSAQCWRWAVFCAMKAGSEARSWYRRAVEAGDVSAMLALGGVLRDEGQRWGQIMVSAGC